MSPQSRSKLNPFARQFMFATGIENSYPTISLPDGKTFRVDEMGGVPILGFTWYSLTDQVDWDTALRENAGRVNPPRKPALSPELRSWSMVVVSIYFKDDSHAAAPRRNAPSRENASRHLNIAQRGLRSFTQFC